MGEVSQELAALTSCVDKALAWYRAIEDTVTEGSPAWEFYQAYLELEQSL